MSVPSMAVAGGATAAAAAGRADRGSVAPGRPTAGGTARPAGGRSRPQEVGDFLGINQPLREVPRAPGGPGAAPGVAGRRPGVTEARPGVADRQIGAVDRRAVGQRPVGIGQQTNNLISARPSWSNISNDRVASVRNNWRNSIVNQPDAGRWQERHPDRIERRDNWGDNVRRNWNQDYRDRDWDWDWDGDVFDNDWWDHHDHPVAAWHYWHDFNDYDFNYWWTVPSWAGVTGWFAWAAPPQVWTQPVYYDYGEGGNVTYADNAVRVNDQQVCTTQEFAQSAAELATVTPPTSEEQAAKAEWLPLGTFAVSSSEEQTTPSRILQLAVDKQGIISGTLYNTQTDQAQTVQGRVDKETQRVAMRVGDSQDIVMETGLYNLTQEEAPVLVHFGAEKVENYLLVRLDAPQTDTGQQSTGTGRW